MSLAADLVTLEAGGPRSRIREVCLAFGVLGYSGFWYRIQDTRFYKIRKMEGGKRYRHGPISRSHTSHLQVGIRRQVTGMGSREKYMEQWQGVRCFECVGRGISKSHRGICL
jgi:hypothetical protein